MSSTILLKKTYKHGIFSREKIEITAEELRDRRDKMYSIKGYINGILTCEFYVGNLDRVREVEEMLMRLPRGKAIIAFDC